MVRFHVGPFEQKWLEFSIWPDFSSPSPQNVSRQLYDSYIFLERDCIPAQDSLH